MPELPAVPTGTLSADFGASESTSDDVDFDDLAKRFDALKKKKWTVKHFRHLNRELHVKLYLIESLWLSFIVDSGDPDFSIDYHSFWEYVKILKISQCNIN